MKVLLWKEGKEAEYTDVVADLYFMSEAIGVKHFECCYIKSKLIDKSHSGFIICFNKELNKNIDIDVKLNFNPNDINGSFFIIGNSKEGDFKGLADSEVRYLTKTYLL